MLDSLRVALRILTRPSHGWALLAERGEALGTVIGAFVVCFAPLPWLARTLGHLLLDWPSGGLLIDAFYYPLSVLLLLLALGGALTVVAQREGRLGEGRDAFRVAFYASTPLWLATLLHALPWLAAQTLAPVVGLGGMGYLLYVGLRVALRLPGARAVPLGTALMAGFGLAFLVLTQVFPLLLFAR